MNVTEDSIAAHGAAGGSHFGSASDSRTEIPAFVAAPPQQLHQAERFDPAGFQFLPGGGFRFEVSAVPVGSRPPQSVVSTTMPGFEAGPSSAPRHAATGSPRPRVPASDVALKAVVIVDGRDPPASADDDSDVAGFDPAGFHFHLHGGFFFPARTSPLPEQHLVVRDAQDRPARAGIAFLPSGGFFAARGERRLEALPEPSKDTEPRQDVHSGERTPEPSMDRTLTGLRLRGRLVETLFGAPAPPSPATPRSDVGIIGDGRPARGPASPPEREMAIVPWRQAAGALLEPALTMTGPALLAAALERAGLLPGRQAQSPPLRLEVQARQQAARHRLALAPSRQEDTSDFVVISRDDVRRGWAQLQARRRECEELRQHSHDLATELALQAMETEELKLECWRLGQALYLQQTPHSSGGSLVAGDRRSGVCGDCYGPAQVQLAPCSHVALCHGCYLKRQKCPCCSVLLAFH